METLATSNAYVVDRNVWVNSTARCGDGWFDGGYHYVGRRHIITIECFNFLARMSATCFFSGGASECSHYASGRCGAVTGNLKILNCHCLYDSDGRKIPLMISISAQGQDLTASLGGRGRNNEPTLLLWIVYDRNSPGTR